MSTTQTKTVVDRFVRFLETGDDPDGVLHPDVFVDVNVPHWRYQMQGVTTLVAQLKEDSPYGATITTGRTMQTPTGFVVEAQYVQRDQHGESTLYRTAWIVEVDDDGRVTEAVLYCTGEWDEQTQARQAAEAPMLRP